MVEHDGLLLEACDSLRLPAGDDEVVEHDGSLLEACDSLHLPAGDDLTGSSTGGDCFVASDGPSLIVDGDDEKMNDLTAKQTC